MSLARAVLVLGALPFLGIGVAFLVSPDALAAVVGIELSNATARADTRAVFGGLEIGVGAFLLASARAGGTSVATGLRAMCACYAGLAVARAVSLVVDGPPGEVGFVLWGGEVVGLATGAWVLRR